MFLIQDWMGLVTVSGAVLSTFGVGELLRVRAHWASERTRKLAHIACGIIIFSFPYVLNSVHTVGVLSMAFTLLLLSTRALGLLDSVHAVRRNTLGVIYYPISIYGAALLTWDRPALFQVCVLLLAFADGLAALVGKAYGRHRYALGAHYRTLEGSATVLVVSFVATTLLLGLSGSTSWLAALMIGALLGGLVCAVEALSLHGLDNLFIPLLSAVYLRAAVQWPLDVMAWHFGACLVSLVIAAVCQLRGYLKLNGAVAAWLVAYFTLGFGGVAWFAPLLGFFLSINWIGKIAGRVAGDRIPADFERVEEKGSKRDYLQVFANAGVCLALAIAHAAVPSPVLFWAFIGSISAACADTFASELGILSGRKPVLLWTFQPVPTGLSGGVTLFGYGAAAIGAVLPAAILIGVGSPYSFNVGALFLGTLACGLFGSTIDSLVGATLQSKRRCQDCGKVLEKLEHCGKSSVAHSGLDWVSNDVVNAVGAASGAALGAMIAMLS